MLANKSLSVSEHRLIFQTGDFVRLRDGSIVRLDHIFVHEVLRGDRRLFARVTYTVPFDPSADPVLDIPLLKLTARQSTVGLPAICSSKLYVVPIHEQTLREDTSQQGSKASLLLYCNWEIQYL